MESERENAEENKLSAGPEQGAVSEQKHRTRHNTGQQLRNSEAGARPPISEPSQGTKATLENRGARGREPPASHSD